MGAELVTPANLRLVGGYRLSRFDVWDSIKPDVASRSTGFPWGGMAAYTQPDGTVMVWHENGEQGKEVLESFSAAPMGDATTPPTQWPMLSEGSVWTKADLLPGVETTGYTIPEGLAFDPESQRLWVSFRSTYATAPDPAQWVAAINYPTKELNTQAKPDLRSIRAQRYGGGMSIVPQAFADAHFGGKRLAFMSGGLTSGQGGSAGPTLGVMDLTPSVNQAFQELMWFADTATVGADRTHGPPDPTKDHVERALTDYGPAVVDWAHPPEDTNGDGVLDVGYFGTSSIRGGGAWVDSPGFEGLLYMSAQPTGPVKYEYQTENLSQARANNLYVYDPDDIAKLASGELAHDAIRGKFYRWDKSNNGGIGALARAVSYDPGSGYLWVYYPGVWSSGVERHPIVAAYELVTETSLPLPGDFNRDGAVNAEDFVVWRNAFGTQLSRVVREKQKDGKVTQVATPTYDTDLNGDGLVDDADHRTWLIASQADANNNGRIDIGDYTVWLNAFLPRPASIKSNAAPEPDAMLMLLSVAAATGGSRGAMLRTPQRRPRTLASDVK